MSQVTRQSLQRKITLPLVIAGALCAGVLVTLFFADSHTRLETSLRTRAQTVTGAVAYAADVTHSTQLHRFVSALGGEHGIAMIVVVSDWPAKVTATTRHEWLGQPLDTVANTGVRTSLHRALQRRASEEFSEAERGWFGLATPIVLPRVDRFATEAHHGAVLVYLEVDHFQSESMRSQAYFALIGAALLAAVAMVCWWLLNRHVVKPMRGVAEALQRSERTNATIAVSEDAPLEIACMAQQLDSSFKQVRAAESQARMAMSAKGEFLARMSHEIRTPMNGVIGMLETLLGTSVTAEQAEYLGTAYASADTLLVLINDILDYSKMEAGKLNIECVDFDLTQVVTSTTLLSAIRAKNKGLELRQEIDPSLPRAVRGDPTRISQVLGNLVNNAVKFTQSGSVTVRVAPDDSPTVRARAVGIRFTVSDTGMGVDANTLSRLFTAFTQADGSTARRFGGTGLGLAISRQLVEMMGGEIRVNSEVGRGSAFSFSLALDEAAPAEPLCEASAGTVDREKITGCNVLVVDDNDTNRAVAKVALSRFGIQCDLACDGREAIAILQERRYDLILMDCHMPEIDGFEATRLIRRCENEQNLDPAHIVAVTASAFPEDRERCKVAGMDDFIVKPLRLADLATLLQRWSTRVGARATYLDRGAPLPTVPQEILFDVAQLDEMRLILGDGLGEMICGLEAAAQSAFKGLRSAHERGDAEALRRSAHKFKGTLATLGAKYAADIAFEMEVIGRQGAIENAAALIERLETAYHESHRYLSELLHTEPPEESEDPLPPTARDSMTASRS